MSYQHQGSTTVNHHNHVQPLVAILDNPSSWRTIMPDQHQDGTTVNSHKHTPSWPFSIDNLNSLRTVEAPSVYLPATFGVP